MDNAKTWTGTNPNQYAHKGRSIMREERFKDKPGGPMPVVGTYNVRCLPQSHAPRWACRRCRCRAPPVAAWFRLHRCTKAPPCALLHVDANGLVVPFNPRRDPLPLLRAAACDCQRVG